ncbi:MAG: TIGR01777 family oxidoreductase [Pseudonocardiales bacterium]
MVIAGSSGLIGTALRRSYEREGHTVVRLVRREPRAPNEVQWDPCSSTSKPGLLDGADVVVNLAGANIGGQRWTREYREVILRSRTDTARTLAVSAALAVVPPKVLLSASGIRYYGVDRGEEILTESATAVADGFLPGVTHAWEAATEPAAVAGIPVCHLRLGIVLSRQGGALPRMLPVFRAGLGARLGSGRQFWSYISLADTIAAIRFLATRPGACGPYNITAPDPVRNSEFTDALAAALGHRARLRVPARPLRLALGEVAAEALGSLRVIPARLVEAGFQHRHCDVESALADALS